MKRLRLYLRLINTKGLGVRKINKLITYIGGIENFSEEVASEVLGKTLAKRVARSLKTKTINEERVLDCVKRHNISVSFLEDKNYPRELKTIDEPPPFLFYKGELPEGGIGVVGTRNPSKISLEVVEKLVKEKKRDVISGGARGIDLKAHEEALKHGFRTFVILGSGILNTPFGVKKLLERYNDKVSLISEFLPFQGASRYTFPQRNRIIAALSEEVYVIEAGSKSGSLITAKYAIKYGKPLYAFVGDKGSERWEGCLNLIKRGLAKEYKLHEDKAEGTLIEFLKKPRTYDEIAAFLGVSGNQTLKILSKLMIKGVIKKEGAYYISI